MGELLSIIVPVYNVEKYLSKCVESILQQTYKNLELILVNDGSSDNSGDICDAYKVSDSRVKVFHKKNGGVSSARNIGIENANGKYVLFCDSDDYVEPEWAAKLVEQIKEYPKSWSFCGYHYVDENDCYIKRNCVYQQEPVIETLEMCFYEDVYRTGYSAMLWNRIFDLDIIKRYNIRFDEKMVLSEDVLFNLEYATLCDKFIVVNLPLYNYRMYTNSEIEHLSGKKYKEMFYINSRVYNARKPFILSDNLVKYETDFFYRFIEDIRGIATDSQMEKKYQLKRIKEILKSREFQTTLRKGNLINESWKLKFILKHKSAILVKLIFSLNYSRRSREGG